MACEWCPLKRVVISSPVRTPVKALEIGAMGYRFQYYVHKGRQVMGKRASFPREFE